MVYKVLGLMSGSSLNGLDIAYIDFQETAGKWTYEITASECIPYPEEWINKLKAATGLSARDYQLLHTDYGAYTAGKINAFISKYSLQHKVHLAAVHGHTTFHMPERRMTAQLGDGAAIAALTELPVVTELRALDIAFGGQGAPLVPIGEKLLFAEYDLFLNLGGIANISGRINEDYIAFDVCPANRVLNMLANKMGKEYDDAGTLSASGTVSRELLTSLEGLDYYSRPWPKSLSNEFGTETVFPLLENSGLTIPDSLRTYVEHISLQIKAAVKKLSPDATGYRLLVTGGGAFNDFLISRLRELLGPEAEMVIPAPQLIIYKEALIMGLIGLLRWREEYNALATVTGAKRNSIGGALWMGTEA